MTDQDKSGHPLHSAAFEALAAVVRDAPDTKPPRTRVPSAPRLADVEVHALRGRLPSSWYGTSAPDAPDFNRDMLRAGGFGLATGAVLVLPLIWLLQGEPETAPQLAVDEAPLMSLIAANRRDVSLSTAVLPPTERMRALIELARLRIFAGDVVAARTLLSRADVARDGDALFLMAETYDPARLAIWGAHAASADVQRARALYAAANALGHAEADARLATLD